MTEMMAVRIMALPPLLLRFWISNQRYGLCTGLLNSTRRRAFLFLKQDLLQYRPFQKPFRA